MKPEPDDSWAPTPVNSEHLLHGRCSLQVALPGLRESYLDVMPQSFRSAYFLTAIFHESSAIEPRPPADWRSLTPLGRTLAAGFSVIRLHLRHHVRDGFRTSNQADEHRAHIEAG